MLSMEQRYVQRLFRSVLGENAGRYVNAPGQPVLCNGVAEDPPDTDPAVEGHKGHNHVPPPRLGGVGDEIDFPTPATLRCFFFSWMLFYN